MNLYQFIASLVQSLAWPLAIAFVFWLFRRQVREMLPRMRLKYGEFDLSIHRLDAAEKEAAKNPLPISAEAPPKPTPEEEQKFERIAELSPRAAILELRNELEERLLKFADGRGLTLSPLHTSMMFVVRALREQRLIDEVTSALFDDLRAVGNAAAHDRAHSFTESEAIRFKNLYEVVVARMRAIEAGQIKPD